MGGFQGLVHDTGQVITTESRSTVSCSRAANAATVWSASYRARLNRRSTIRCTRRRSGLNSAAAASVAAATSTGEENDAAPASATTPAYTPMSSPVTMAYARVREISRSMSYSRYLKIATPMLTGSARTATMPRLPAMCRIFDGLFDSGTPSAPPTTATADPPTSHFSCRRRSPDERR